MVEQNITGTNQDSFNQKIDLLVEKKRSPDNRLRIFQSFSPDIRSRFFKPGYTLSQGIFDHLHEQGYRFPQDRKITDIIQDYEKELQDKGLDPNDTSLPLDELAKIILEEKRLFSPSQSSPTTTTSDTQDFGESTPPYIPKKLLTLKPATSPSLRAMGVSVSPDPITLENLRSAYIQSKAKQSSNLTTQGENTQNQPLNTRESSQDTRSPFDQLVEEKRSSNNKLRIFQSFSQDIRAKFFKPGYTLSQALFDHLKEQGYQFSKDRNITDIIQEYETTLKAKGYDPNDTTLPLDELVKTFLEETANKTQATSQEPQRNFAQKVQEATAKNLQGFADNIVEPGLQRVGQTASAAVAEALRVAQEKQATLPTAREVLTNVEGKVKSHTTNVVNQTRQKTSEIASGVSKRLKEPSAKDWGQSAIGSANDLASFTAIPVTPLESSTPPSTSPAKDTASSVPSTVEDLSINNLPIEQQQEIQRNLNVIHELDIYKQQVNDRIQSLAQKGNKAPYDEFKKLVDDIASELETNQGWTGPANDNRDAVARALRAEITQRKTEILLTHPEVHETPTITPIEIDTSLSSLGQEVQRQIEQRLRMAPTIENTDRQQMEELIKTLNPDEQERLRERYGFVEEKQENLETLPPLSPLGQNIMNEIKATSNPNSLYQLKGDLETRISTLPDSEKKRLQDALVEEQRKAETLPEGLTAKAHPATEKAAKGEEEREKRARTYAKLSDQPEVYPVKQATVSTELDSTLSPASQEIQRQIINRLILQPNALSEGTPDREKVIEIINSSNIPEEDKNKLKGMYGLRKHETPTDQYGRVPAEHSVEEIQRNLNETLTVPIQIDTSLSLQGQDVQRQIEQRLRMIPDTDRTKAFWEGSADRKRIEDLIRTLPEEEQEKLRERYLKEEKQENLKPAIPLSPQGRDIMNEILIHSKTSIAEAKEELEARINNLPNVSEKNRLIDALNKKLEDTKLATLRNKSGEGTAASRKAEHLSKTETIDTSQNSAQNLTEPAETSLPNSTSVEFPNPYSHLEEDVYNISTFQLALKDLPINASDDERKIAENNYGISVHRLAEKLYLPAKSPEDELMITLRKKLGEDNFYAVIKDALNPYIKERKDLFFKAEDRRNIEQWKEYLQSRTSSDLSLSARPLESINE